MSRLLVADHLDDPLWMVTHHLCPLHAEELGALGYCHMCSTNGFHIAWRVEQAWGGQVFHTCIRHHGKNLSNFLPLSLMTDPHMSRRTIIEFQLERVKAMLLSEVPV